MATSTKEYISTLNNLIETCKDGENGFRTAAEGITRSDLQSTFREYAGERSRFASELQMEVARLGGEAEKSGSVSAALHRGWIDIKSAVTGKDDHAILAECERGEDSAVKNYQQALGAGLPSDLRSIVEKQYQQVQQAHNKIRALRDSAKTGATAAGSN